MHHVVPRLSITCLVFLLLTAAPVPPAQAEDLLARLPVVRWGPYQAEMVEFNVGPNRAYVVKPLRSTPDGFKPWVWYAPSLSTPEGKWTLRSERHAEVVKPLLEKGFYFCGVDVGESYGGPAGRRTFTEFHRTLVDRFGLAPKACLFPVSRGGAVRRRVDLTRCPRWPRQRTRAGNGWCKPWVDKALVNRCG